MAELEAALREEIRRVQEEGVGEAELQRVRAQLLASQVYKLDSMFGQAMEIGQMESAGIAHTLHERIMQRLQAVTAADVQAVARRYFRDEQLTVGVLDPQPLDGKPRRPAVPVRH